MLFYCDDLSQQTFSRPKISGEKGKERQEEIRTRIRLEPPPLAMVFSLDILAAAVVVDRWAE